MNPVVQLVESSFNRNRFSSTAVGNLRWGDQLTRNVATLFSGACLCAAGLAAPAIGRAQAPLPGTGSFDIQGFVRVIDGDTFEVYINGRQSGIGIIGIRAPMGNTPCGRSATARLISYIGRGGIRLEEDR